MRALDNNIKIHVGFIKDYPLGVDTQEDLDKIRLLYNEK
jgi:3-deoxy-manno-octulosonate cytidylyltransferase (CMP-KDO synthetase)